MNCMASWAAQHPILITFLFTVGMICITYLIREDNSYEECDCERDEEEE